MTELSVTQTKDKLLFCTHKQFSCSTSKWEAKRWKRADKRERVSVCLRMKEKEEDEAEESK